MTASSPKLFNATALSFAQHRAQKRQARTGHSFLYQRAVQDAASRLEDINRRFGHAVLIGGADGRALLTSALPETRQPTQFDYVQTPHELTGQYDLILSLLELQSDEALPQTLTKFRQHLSADGLLLAAQFGGDTLNELRQSLYGTDQQVFGGAMARVFPLVDYSKAALLLGRAGLALPVVDTDRVSVHYGHLKSLVSDLRDLGLTNSLTARDTRPLSRMWWMTLQQIYAAHFARADGKLRASFDILWLTGWAPHANQQKPLKPGSAKMRLSDALKTQERKL